jgi:MFS family permease
MRALRWLFAVAVLPGVAAMAALWIRVRDIAPAAKPVQGATQVPVWRQLPRRFVAFVATVTVFALGNSSDMFIVFLGWTRHGLGLLHIVALWIGLHLAKIAFGIPGGTLSDRFGRRPLIICGWLVYALIYLGLAVSHSAAAFVALVVAYGAYYGLTEGAEKALVADFAPPELRGTAFGIYHGAVGLAAFPASVVFGTVWQTFGPQASFGIGAALAGLACVMLTVLLAATPAAELKPA